MQETAVGSGIYIIQGTDGRWYQMNGQDDSGQVIHEPLPSGNQVSDKILDILYKLDEFKKASGSETTLNLPEAIDIPIGANIDGSAYLYVYAPGSWTNCPYIQVYKILDGAVLKWERQVNWGWPEIVFVASNVQRVGYIIDDVFVSGGDYGGCSISGNYMWHSISAHGSEFKWWTNSYSAYSNITGTWSNVVNGIEYAIPEGFNLDTGGLGIDGGGGYAPTPEMQKIEMDKGVFNDYLVTTNFFNVKLQGPIDVNVKNYDELVEKLKIAFDIKDGEDGEDGEAGEAGLDGKDGVDAKSKKIFDNSLTKITDKVNQIGEDDPGSTPGDDENEVKNESVLTFPFKILKRFVDGVTGLEKKDIIIFPSITWGEYTFNEPMEVSFSKIIADAGLTELHRIYFLLTDAYFTFLLISYAKKKISEFAQGKGDLM